MPRVRSTWLVGSIEALPLQSFTIDAVPSEVPAGSWYLYAASAGFSLLAELASEMTAAGLGAVSVVVLESRLVRISASGIFAITWGSATTLRDLLGFSGDLSGASSYTAAAISPLLWSGGQVSKATPTGIAAYPVEDAEISVSTDGSLQLTTHYATHYHDTWSWAAVHLSRYWSSTSSGGVWQTFRTTVVVPGARIQCFEVVEEDSSSTTAVTWPTRIGVYKARELPAGAGERAPGFESTNTWWKVQLSVRLAEEYP